jgi:putative transposase
VIDITCLPMAKGCVCTSSPSSTGSVARYGCPGLFNSDQGSQFISTAFTKALKDRGIEISMDGRRAWKDNGCVECLRRSIK